MKSPIDFRADQGQHMDRDQTYLIRKELEGFIKEEYGFTQAELDDLLEDHYTNDGILMVIQNSRERTKESFRTALEDLIRADRYLLDFYAMSFAEEQGASDYTLEWN